MDDKARTRMLVLATVALATFALWMRVRPKIVEGEVVGARTVRLATDVTDAELRLASRMVAEPAFLEKLATRLGPRHLSLVERWTAENTDFAIQRGPSGEVRLTYSVPTYSVKRFSWSDLGWQHVPVGTHEIPEPRDAAETASEGDPRPERPPLKRKIEARRAELDAAIRLYVRQVIELAARRLADAS